MKRKMIEILMTVMLLGCLWGCQAGNAADEGADDPVNSEKIQAQEESVSFEKKEYTFTDDLGREIKVSDIHRVAVLNASYADVWALAGGADQIVGAADNTWADVDFELKPEVVNLGNHNEISLELLLSCSPDLVLASTDVSQNVEEMASYEAAGLNVAYFGVTTFEDYLRMLKICTEITGRVDCYELYGEAVRKQAQAALDKADGSAPKVLFVRATTGSVKVKNSKGTVLGQMLKDMGCINIADTEKSLLEDLSMEVIMEQDPDFIFAIYMGTDTEAIEGQMEATLFSDGGWQTLQAIQNNRFYVMDKELYSLKPNERWGEAYEKLAMILYGK